MAKYQLKRWRSKASPFPHQWCPDRVLSAPAEGSQLFPITADRTPGDSLLPQNLASRCERGTGSESRTGRGGGKQERGAARHPGGRTRPRTTNFTHTSQTQERAEKRPGNWGEGGNLSNGGRRTESGEPSAAWHESGRSGLSGQEPQSGASAQGPPTSLEAPTWQRPGPERAAGSSPASPRLPLPCPGKGFEERRSGRGCARGRRPSSGRRTSPRRGCRSGAVCGKRARRCPASGVRPKRDRLGAGRRRGSVHPGRERRGHDEPPARLLLLLRGGTSSRPRRPAPGRSQRPRPRPRRRPLGWRGRRLRPGKRHPRPDSRLRAQTSSGCSPLSFALSFDFLLLICFLSLSQCTVKVFRLLKEVNELKFVKAPGKQHYQSALGCLAANKQLLKSSFHQGCNP